MLHLNPGIERLYELGHRELPLPPELHAALPAFVHSVGFQEETKASYSWNGLRRGSAELAVIQFTLGGRGRLRFERSEMYVEAGQAMLLCLPHDHCYWIEEGERWEFFYVTLGGQGAVRGIREAVATLGPVLTLNRDSAVLARAAEACADALDGKIESPYRASELAYGIVMALLGGSAPRLGSLPLPPAQTPEFVLGVEQFCRANLTRPIGVEDMARVAGMSRFHFTRVFEKARGISPGRFLASLRLEESLRLIARGSHSVKRIAEECGYGDANYFCKVFRKSFGVSPGAFREGIVQHASRSAQVVR